MRVSEWCPPPFPQILCVCVCGWVDGWMCMRVSVYVSEWVCVFAVPIYFPLAFVLVNDLFLVSRCFLFWKCVRFCFCFCCRLLLFVVCTCILCLLPCLTRCSFMSWHRHWGFWNKPLDLTTLTPAKDNLQFSCPDIGRGQCSVFLS